jgi:hypothetical protein
MKSLILSIVIILISGCANTSYYASAGGGLKFEESDTSWLRNGEKSSSVPLSARFEIGAEKEVSCFLVGTKCTVKAGLSHHSQWFAGWPFNEKGEYSKSELFTDYKWVF